MATTHYLAIDPSTDVVSWVTPGLPTSGSAQLFITRSSDVPEWRTSSPSLGSGQSQLVTDSATDVPAWLAVT